jgi:hypothetical protein
MALAIELSFGQSAIAGHSFSDTNWDLAGIPGVNGTVTAAVVDNWGNLYIGGVFTLAGNVRATNIAKWNGSEWSPLAFGLGGISSATVNALAVSGSNVFAGGSFTKAGITNANYIAKWDGSSWSTLATGLSGGTPTSVRALAVLDSDLYVGGDFTTAGGNSAVGIAKWDGSAWSALGSGTTSGNVSQPVYALAASGGSLYVGGFFTSAGGVVANNVAKWDGTNWTALGAGVNNTVMSLIVIDGNLYTGGYFTAAGGNSANYVAKWNGNAWSALGSGVSGGSFLAVYALASSGADLYAGGGFTTAGTAAVNCVAKWNGSSWSALDSGVTNRTDVSIVNALVMLNSNLYVGGMISTAGDNPAQYVNGIARWNGSSWSGVGGGLGMNGSVTAFVSSGEEFYIGGYFTTLIAKGNGNGWTQLGAGLGPSGIRFVGALAVSGSNVYAGGDFTIAGATTANRIAQWNGSSWSQLGSGMNDQVEALAILGSDVYAGGKFTTAGGNAVNYIARWNGSTWLPLGLGTGGSFPFVEALAVSGTNLYVAGNFTRVTNSSGLAITVNRIAKWDGLNWSSVGSGVDNTIRSLTVVGRDLFAGGDFKSAGGKSALCVAKWNGSTWSALGSGITLSTDPFSRGQVWCMTISGSDLYVGGSFDTAGGTTASNIAKWDGSSWSMLGSGLNKLVSALGVSGHFLYAGGNFTIAGGKTCTYIARADLGTLMFSALSLRRYGPNVVVSWPSPGTAGLSLEEADGLASPISWHTNNVDIADDGTNKSIAVPATNSAQFFRLRGP